MPKPKKDLDERVERIETILDGGLHVWEHNIEGCHQRVDSPSEPDACPNPVCPNPHDPNWIMIL